MTNTEFHKYMDEANGGMTERPDHFTGTAAELATNRATHSFDPQYGRCGYCDCRPYGHWAEYPCRAL